MDASGHLRTVCPRPGMLRRWQSTPVLGFGTKRPLGLPNMAVGVSQGGAAARRAHHLHAADLAGFALSGLANSLLLPWLGNRLSGVQTG